VDAFLAGLSALTDINLVFLLLLATLGGVVIGALPGLNATTGAALLLPRVRLQALRLVLMDTLWRSVGRLEERSA